MNEEIMTTRIFWTEVDPSNPHMPVMRTAELPEGISMESAREVERIIRDMAHDKNTAVRYALLILERQRNSKKMLCDVLDILHGRDESPTDGMVL